MKASNERLTSNESEEPVVVFLIGMRVNRWWKIRQWLRTALAMPRMLRELQQHPELGLLGGESWFGRTTILVSYWKSVDHLFGLSTQDRDYFVDTATIDVIADGRATEHLVGLLRKAVGSSNGVDIRWQRRAEP